MDYEAIYKARAGNLCLVFCHHYKINVHVTRRLEPCAGASPVFERLEGYQFVFRHLKGYQENYMHNLGNFASCLLSTSTPKVRTVAPSRWHEPRAGIFGSALL